MYRTILHLYKGTLEIYGTKREIKTKQTSKKNIKENNNNNNNSNNKDKIQVDNCYF